MSGGTIQAASVALVQRQGKFVLVGERLRPPLAGWYAFPGGKLEPDETHEAAARRELLEETGIDAPGPTLARYRADAVDGERVYAIECFVIEVDELYEPRVSNELRCVWLPLDEALALRPLTPGTERVLRELAGTFVEGRAPAGGLLG